MLHRPLCLHVVFFEVFTFRNTLPPLIISAEFYGDRDIKMGHSIFGTILKETFYTLLGFLEKMLQKYIFIILCFFYMKNCIYIYIR